MTESGAPAADSPANWTSVADLEGAKIAVQEGTTGNDVASAIPDAEVSAFKAVAQCGMELINGRVDCVIVDTHPAQSLVDANPDKLMVLDFPASEETETYAIATQKNDTGAALAEEFNTAMATLQENGTFDALVDKYISKNEDAQLPELKTVENPKGALVMGTNCEFEPFEYLDENGDPTGFDVGFAQYLCAEMGYTLTIENMDFDALIPALQSGRIDFIAAYLTRDEEREKNANFTDGYYEAIQSIVVAKPAA
ncbi:MAG: transporter substrate-binding domain-containing protein [Flavonifractor plautii]